MAEDLTTKAPASAEAVGSGGRGPARQPRLHGEDDGPSAHSSSRIRGHCPASRSREAAGRTLGFCPETAARGCRSSWSFRDDSSRLKDSVLEYEREVIRGMVRAAHLHASDAALDVGIVDAFHLRVDDPVADVFLSMPSEVLAVGFISLIRIVVASRSRIHSHSWNSSSLGFSNLAMTSSTGNESTTRISKLRVRFRFDAYILKISSHVRSAFPSRFRRIAPRSSRLTFDSTS